MKRILFALTIIVLILGSCGRQGAPEHHKLSVTVSLPPQQWILEQIAGDSVEINTLLQAGSNPETFDPGISVIKKASNSDIIMLSGQLGYENVIASRLTGGKDSIMIVDTSVGIEPIYGTHVHTHGEHSHLHKDDISDPHTWTSVKNARIIATNMLQALVKADPDNASYYRERAGILDTHLDSLDRSIAARLAQPEIARSFLIWHPSLSYYARDYDLNQIAIGSENREATIGDIKATLDKAADSGAHVLFMQADYDPRQASTLSQETGVSIIPLNPLAQEWEAQINLITDAITGK